MYNVVQTTFYSLEIVTLNVQTSISKTLAPNNVALAMILILLNVMLELIHATSAMNRRGISFKTIHAFTVINNLKKENAIFAVINSESL